MTPFALITPDRNDRKDFLAHCKEQVERFHFKAPHFIINYPSESEECDIVPRIKRGIKKAKEAGAEWCVIIENDDYMPPDYLDRIIPYMDKYDFIGDDLTYYYHLGSKTWTALPHTGRSSLFTTSFRISALDGFKWPPDKTPFLDLELWKHAKSKKCNFINSAAIGIKHGIGKSGGSGHKKTFRNSDPEMKWLQEHVDSDSFEFYKSLHL
jgi:hypothetical protein